MADDGVLTDHGMSEHEETGKETGEVGDSKIADALDLIEEMVANGELHGRIVPMSGYDTHLSFDPEEHPELANEKMGSPIVVILGGIVSGLPKHEGKHEEGMPVGAHHHKVEGTFYECAIVHGMRTKKKPYKKPEHKPGMHDKPEGERHPDKET